MYYLKATQIKHVVVSYTVAIPCGCAFPTNRKNQSGHQIMYSHIALTQGCGGERIYMEFKIKG